MPNVKNYVLLETITVGATGASSVTFNNIPQTGYTDLKLVVSARCDSSAIFGQLMLEINSSGTITDRLIQGDGSAANSYTNSVGELGPMVTGANATANTFGSAELYFPNYAGSANKSVSVDGVSETNATTIYQVLTAALRANTSPITSITLKVRDGSQVSKNFVQYSTFSLYGLAAVGTTPTIAPKATGGDIIDTDGTYWYHTFLYSGTFTPQKALNVDYLVVAGGGGGGGGNPNVGAGGGGAAGGMRCTVTATGGGGSLESALALANGTNYTVTIGAGGAAGGSNVNGTVGSNSVFSTITSTGGGYGGRGSIAGGNGGSGGGAGGSANAAAAGTASPSGQGYNGGSAGGNAYGGAGGGGAGAVGANAGALNGGNGGNGVATVINGSSVTYAGGGGGGKNGAVNVNGTGGTGGGGTGGTSAGTANTGGGGGGGIQDAGAGGTGYAGGSGIVIVRYAVTA